MNKLKKKEKNKTEQEVDIKLIKKFLQKKCNHNEHELVLNWFTDFRYERKLKYIINEHWDEIELKSTDYDLDTNRFLDKLHHLIHLDSYKKSRDLPFYRKAYQQLSKVAAILLLPLLIGGGWYYLIDRQSNKEGEKSYPTYERTSYSEIFSPRGARTRFELPDGSAGWLNSGSTLRFPVKFNGPQRVVELCGEAFFSVIKDPDMPLVVKVREIEIIALGTEFNVSCYPDDETCAVTLEKGKVIVEKTTESRELQRLAELLPGQRIIISGKTDKVEVHEVVTDNYTSWKKGKLVFRNDPMNEVVKRVGRWYNVEFILQDEALLDYRYRATFVDETLDEVLKLLKLTSPIDYVEHKREMLPDGLFAKKKITFFLKPGY